ncbi:MAG TPA: metalloregulator ArsR/SmtB family transcription factor [Bacteroidales bacterium]|nr:metalloregulator ArsR/SmtB family transcription factor [Bacteroidales bacterium]
MLNHYQKNHKIDLKKFEKYIDKLRVMSHPVRFAILVMLTHRKKMTVTEIYEELSIQQAAASNHLKTLKSHELILSKKNGKNTNYFINNKTISKLGRTLNLNQSENNKE